jgi:hypothetical protein
MRIKVRYPNGNFRQIDTLDPDLAARWLREHVAPLAAVHDYEPSQIEVWAESDFEVASIGQYVEGLAKLAEGILKALPPPDDAARPR